MLNLTRFGTDHHFSKLKQPVNKSDWTNHGGAAVVNAFYYNLENSIGKNNFFRILFQKKFLVLRISIVFICILLLVSIISWNHIILEQNVLKIGYNFFLIHSCDQFFVK